MYNVFFTKFQPGRRRTPIKTIRDLAPSESTYHAAPARDRVGVTTPLSAQPSVQPPTQPTRRVNYNYHPIIDFFETEHPQERSDHLPLGDSDWRPVTAYGLAQQFRNRN